MRPGGSPPGLMYVSARDGFECAGAVGSGSGNETRVERLVDACLGLFGIEPERRCDLGREGLLGLVAQHALRVVERTTIVRIDERCQDVDDTVEVTGAEALLEALQLLVPG